jgi:ribosomal protein S18 acetylase RimI-like enzyme
VDAEGVIRGLAVGTRVSDECGHLAQICVTPELQGSGLAYELLRRTLAALRSEGARELSLTVTMQNERAVRLYQRFGFRTIHSFDAWVWDGI